MIRAVYDTQDEIPEAHRELFTERAGRWELTEVEGIKTEGDVTRLREALRKEREDHTATKDRLTPWERLGESAASVQEQLDRIPVLEASQGKIDEAKIEEIAKTRSAAERAPLERQIAQLTEDLGSASSRLTEYETREVQRTIADGLREAATGGGDKRRFPAVRGTAIKDVVKIGLSEFEALEDGSIVHKETRIGPMDWLADQQKIRPYWWPESEGAGVRGGDGNGPPGMNPWASDHWNMTKQGEYLREHGEEAAQKMARAAGTSLGGMPPKK